MRFYPQIFNCNKIKKITQIKYCKNKFKFTVEKLYSFTEQSERQGKTFIEEATLEFPPTSAVKSSQQVPRTGHRGAFHGPGEVQSRSRADTLLPGLFEGAPVSERCGCQFWQLIGLQFGPARLFGRIAVGRFAQDSHLVAALPHRVRVDGRFVDDVTGR